MTEKSKQTKQDQIREYILTHPTSSIREIQHALGFSKRTVMYAREKMVKEGLLPPSRQTQPEHTNALNNREPVEITKMTELVEGKTLYELAEQEDFDEEIGDDLEIQKKLMKEVRSIAFNPLNHPDVRLSAITIWAKLKDLEKTKDLGPGPPRKKEDIIERLVRLMKGVGPKIVLESIEVAFPKSKTLENAKIDEI